MTEKIPVKKNKEYIVDIIDNGFEGEGIAKIDNYTIFVSGAIKGEKVKILILKVKSSYAFGKILEIMKKSDNRVEHDCNTYKRCGGCNLRHMKYPATLELKQLMVQNLVNKILDSNIEVKPTIGMEIPYFYRNKGQFPIGYTKEGEMTFGVYANRSHEIVPIKICKIQNLISQKITKYILKFMKQNNVMAYNEKNRIGEVRHIVIKIGIKTSEIMCILVTNRRKITQEDKLVSELVHNFPNIRSIVKNINMENTNVILGKENINLWGDGYIEDKLGEYTFKISPLSFYQTNFIQTQKLYDLAVKMAKLTKEDVAVDLYCGIGTIAIFVSRYVKEVYGIEILEEAIEDAKENAKINNINNINFLCGDVKNIFEKIILKKNVKPSIVFLDPPRKGIDDNTIQIILKMEISRLIYISCNPRTLIRDLKKFEDKYYIKEIIPIDMFPYTSHVECCSVLYLKN